MKKHIEFVVRSGYASLHDVAEYLGYSDITMYQWAVEQRDSPVGFPEAIRMGTRWMISWEGIQKWLNSCNTKAQERKKGIIREAFGKDNKRRYLKPKGPMKKINPSPTMPSSDSKLPCVEEQQLFSSIEAAKGISAVGVTGISAVALTDALIPDDGPHQKARNVKEKSVDVVRERIRRLKERE